jgi:hypothetical protein|tara:strand:- start:63 stop:218 length:156 start_codon:yes stop_codon:yes gene_type:complete
MHNITKRCIALKEAKKNAKDPEFKKLWDLKLKELLNWSTRIQNEYMERSSY